MFRFVRPLITDFVDLLFPNLCLGCSQILTPNEQMLCIGCRLKLPETGQHRAPYQVSSINKFAGKVPVSFSFSYLYFSKGSLVQRLIHQIKYRGQKEAAQVIAGWYGYQLKTETTLCNDVDFLVSVPLHKSRLRQRGYNQADLIAAGLANALNIPARTDILIRKRFKSSQTNKNRMERWENVKTVFAVVNSEVVKDRNIIVVDDVLTTGATIEACITELLKAGCRSVGVLTIAVTK